MKASKKIERLFREERWIAAQKIILIELRKSPRDHWLLTRLSSIYYEEKKYNKALEIVKKAYKIAPSCPLVNWDYAGTQYMLNDKKEAIKIWKRLVKRGVKSIAYDECGEGLPWARSLVNDCLYRIGLAYKSMGNYKLAIKYISDHIRNRNPNCKSIYNLRKVKKRLEQIKG